MTLNDGLFGDDKLRGILSAPAQVAAMLRVEAALARVQGALGIIPEASARSISSTAEALSPDPASLTAATAMSGIAAQSVAGALKMACGEDAARAHFGATSQDIQDSGLVLQLREALVVLEGRLGRLDKIFTLKAARYADQPIPARTRFQIAAPTTLGAKIAVWRAPLARHLARLSELRPRLLNVSLYGAAGTGAALAPRMPDVREALAAELDLGAQAIPWHAARDGMAELGGWLALVSGTLGKFGADLVLLGQSGIGEVSAGPGGGSSTMPQKSNPVAAEALVGIARLNAGAAGTLYQAMIHAQERDGSALALEWQTLPEMIIRTGAALRHALELAEALAPCPDRINASFAGDRGAMLAEAAGFHLARHMPREKALKLVSEALAGIAANDSETLAGALARLAPGHDWPSILAPENNTGDAETQARLPDGSG
ncbi:lyase family protein [uncultured Roseovarius sp.]|uniref:lyase family protein n=1 Tax=uncultured Roseovarius sp. TaxID=293344 RepID=UPI002606016C|nr:lyase family protein [uncultured Roseovarius sp.]